MLVTDRHTDRQRRIQRLRKTLPALRAQLGSIKKHLINLPMGFTVKIIALYKNSIKMFIGR